MSITETTPASCRQEASASSLDPRPNRRGTPEMASTSLETTNAPALLIQLQDDLQRSRVREAFWISVVLHLAVVMSVVFAPRLFPARRAVLLATPADLINQKELTYLALPPDRQAQVQPPKTDIISDKNRIAASRTPTLDRKELKRILDSSTRPGAPGGAQQQPAPPQQQVAQAPQQQPGPANQQRGDVPVQQPPVQTAQIPRPPPGAFSGSMSAGSLIEQATRNAASSRGGGPGVGGDYGAAQSPSGGKAASDMEIMSDTMGVDFGPYLSRVLHVVRQNWYTLIPEVARPPLMKRGKVSIEFAIMKDGSIAGMKLIFPSGDSSLDRAAWGGILGSNPFPPLPTEFRGDYLALRFHFYYNPDRNEMR